MTAVIVAASLILVVGPLLLGVQGFNVARRKPAGEADRAGSWDWKLTITSALLYALAFNLIFFIQELFLVLPKALTPGLRPTLFHNNHRWEGDNPLASLFQGTGALATLITGLICAFLLKRRVGRSSAMRLFLIWMAYNGFMQSLPQVVVGSIEPQNDVGMAMEYLQFGAPAKTAAAFVALIAIAAAALKLRGPLLSLAEKADDIATGRAAHRVHVTRSSGTGIGGDPADHSLPNTAQLGGGGRSTCRGDDHRSCLDPSRSLGGWGSESAGYFRVEVGCLRLRCAFDPAVDISIRAQAGDSLLLSDRSSASGADALFAIE